ncbi:MAG: XdhC family protein [Rhodobacteraceae bacterium]|nr:XdhC family protein [Paracoccaceae bacterium]
MKLELLTALNEERAARRAAIVVTDMSSGVQRLIKKHDGFGDDPLFDELDKRFRSSKSGMIEDENGQAFFLTVSVPPPRLVIIGAVHISQALVPMAQLAGFDVSVVDPRTAFASADRFPGADLCAEWPEAYLRDKPFDPFTAVAAVTHDPKIDDLPLQTALSAGCFYVGALGSRKTHGKRQDRLLSAGVSEDAFQRIDAPIGLDIGASSPAEIAVSILGSVISALRQKPTS